MGLEIVWFWLIALLWGGYFVLEGFDFGVGILLPFLGRDERDRSEMFQTVGPVWDGNEVWLVVAGASIFAAFPAWYATMFSGFYLALLIVLVCLMIRVVSFEWREKSESPRWRRDVAMGQHDRQRRGPAHLGDRAGQPPARRAARLGRRVRRQFRRPLQRLHGARGHRDRAAVRVPRCHVPHAAHQRRAVRASGRSRTAPRPSRCRGGRRVPRLDGGRRARSQSARGAAGGRAGRDRDRRAPGGGGARRRAAGACPHSR